jgi:LEA14-like dessication related protein
MRKLLLLTAVALLLNACSMFSELVAFTKCEFRLQSLRQPEVCGINISQKSSWSDFSLMEGQIMAAQLLQKRFPFEITVNVEARNPGSTMAAVNSIQWIAMLDELQLAQGMVSERVEVPANGGTSTIPVRIRADLFDYLEGGNARSMLDFALNLINAGKQSSQLSMKIKPSVLIGGQEIQYPDYFTITKEFKSGN